MNVMSKSVRLFLLGIFSLLLTQVNAQGPRSTRPSITSISPTSGPVGTLVTIDGLNLFDVNTVKIKSLSVPFTIVDSFTVTFLVPVGAVSGNVSVQCPHGKDNGGRFVIVPPLPQPPSITSFSPASDSVGYIVTVAGTNFDNATAVTLNGQAVTFNVIDSVTIEFTVPVGATSGLINVTNPDGTATSSTTFTVLMPYVPTPPTITSFTPTSGLVGTTVTVSGTNFSTATSLSLNGGTSIPFTIVNNTTITFVVPTGATSGVIAITNPDGTATSIGSFTVTVPTFPPTITSISPTSGLVGTTVTITGTNLSTVTSVTLNGLSVTYTIVSNTSITFVVPVGATSGIVSVTNPDGSANGPTFTVTVPTFPPTITSISPTSGLVGTVVTVNGTNFTTVTNVTLNGLNVTFSINSSTQLIFIVPTGATSGTVSVINPDGTANGPTFTVTTVTNLPVITRGAYMVGPKATSINIQWRTDVACNSEVWYGTNPSFLGWSVSNTANVTDHTISLSNLTPNTKYYYSVGIVGTALQSGSTNTFMTANTDTSTETVRFWVTGDFGNNSTNQKNVLTAFKNYTATGLPVRAWVWLGDNAYSNGTDAEYTTNVFNVYGNLFNSLPVLPELGNHDYGQTGYQSSTSRGTTAPYFNIFAIPTNSGTEKYYSTDYGQVHFIGLDSYGSYNNLTSPMYTWLQNDLSNNKLPWVVVYWHHPPYTKGSHNSDTEIELIDMRTNIVPLLEQWGVDVVLGGHSHIYERSMFIKDHFGLESTFDNNIWPVGNVVQSSANSYTKTSLRGDGTVYTVCGVSGQAGGATASGYPHNAMQVSTTSNNGSLILDVNKNTLNCKFLTTSGTIFDQFTITKTIGAPRLSGIELPVITDESYYDISGRYLGNDYTQLPINQLVIYRYNKDGEPQVRKIVKVD